MHSPGPLLQETKDRSRVQWAMDFLHDRKGQGHARSSNKDINLQVWLPPDGAKNEAGGDGCAWGGGVGVGSVAGVPGEASGAGRAAGDRVPAEMLPSSSSSSSSASWWKPAALHKLWPTAAVKPRSPEPPCPGSSRGSQGEQGPKPRAAGHSLPPTRGAVPAPGEGTVHPDTPSQRTVFF